MNFYQKIILIAALIAAASADPAPVNRIKEVKFFGGSADATSFLDHNWMPEEGFQKQMAINNGWHIGPIKGPRAAQNLPVMIWYDFKTRSIKPAEVSIQPAQSGGATQGAPSSWQLVGSNDVHCDDDSAWTVLCEDLSDRKWRNYWEVRYCRVKPEMNEKFRCMGLRVLNNQRSDGWTSLRNIRLWERV